MEDHHVDRLGVEAWQHVKLTSTNCSIGLIAGCLQDPSGSERQPLKPPRTAARFVDTNCFDLAQVFFGFASHIKRCDRQDYCGRCTHADASHHAFGRPGGYSGGATPDPIPNSAVKTPSADGTVS